MGRSLLRVSILVLSLLIAAASGAEEVIQNGGFESGNLFPWEEVGDSRAWCVTDSYAYEGAYSALVRGPYALVQSFEPKRGADIEVFSLAVMTGMNGWISVEVGYADDLGPTRASVYAPAALQWQLLDLRPYVDPHRSVQSVALYGHTNGDSPDDMRTWYDAVTLQNNSPGPAPDPVPEIEVIEAVPEKVKLKLNLKKPKTHLQLQLTAEELPEGIQEGPVNIRVLLTQDGLTTGFEAEAELVEVPNKKNHIIELEYPAHCDKPCEKK
jgi:hypothetical protein